MIFVHDVDTVTDALGVAELDCFADVETEAVGGDEARSDLAGVESDVHSRIDRVQIVEHEHLPVILGHGEVTILGDDEVDADDDGMSGV
jgi:hypothetical protein